MRVGPSGLQRGSDSNRARPGFIAIGLVLLFAVWACSSTSPTAATPTPTPSASPTPTADAQYPIFHAYTTVFNADLVKQAQARADMATACGASGTPPNCRSKLQVFIDVVSGFLTELSAVPAPTCLASVDPEIKKGLTNMQAGAQRVASGIDSKSQSQVDAGTAIVNSGVGEFDGAADSLLSEVTSGRCHQEFAGKNP